MGEVRANLGRVERVDRLRWYYVYLRCGPDDEEKGKLVMASDTDIYTLTPAKCYARACPRVACLPSSEGQPTPASWAADRPTGDPFPK